LDLNLQIARKQFDQAAVLYLVRKQLDQAELYVPTLSALSGGGVHSALVDMQLEMAHSIRRRYEQLIEEAIALFC